MSPPERRARLSELRTWVEWLCHTAELHNEVPPCWYQHRWLREMLTALYLGWLRAYEAEKPAGRAFTEADWISTVNAFKPYLKLPACLSGHQEPPLPPLSNPGADDAFELYLATSPDTTDPARHPAEAATRRITTKIHPIA
ncbi:hypothetical protein F9278_24020 [Streptomyces phaeolivaceus]|uniref:DUF4913 domain-containing protein n=2 Tax=Streptomyces phaeolivaceus TaxID=2653200 RepID=A0A5P8KJ29_9ACTN|nr:hypothetical protein F9278_24020 [Streptomyces phaeolivaceus]